VIYTIGHSTHTASYFLEMLKTFSIDCVIDVRSIAASSYNPQFNKKALSTFLNINQITYLHFADEFGARHENPKLLDYEGKVDFEKVRQSISFKNGVERLRQGVFKGFTIALMCSESDPFDCHRFSMVSIALAKEGFEVKHILKDMTLKSNAQLENRLLKKYEKKIPHPNIFESKVALDNQLEVAYRLRNREIAFSPNRQLEEKYD